MERKVMIPGPDHPITITPTGTRVVVRAGGRVIADSTRALTLQESDYAPVQYIPYEDVTPGALRPSDSLTYCPFKGDASYYTLTTPEGEVADAVWTYEKPYESVGEIAGHVAFYLEHVELSVEAAA